jgi:2-polyprenyl-6-methoxyphenol hydroxylase-like FAD-dependent oxidoreductase
LTARPRVLVAGGSLGGLIAAHVLSDEGCDVEVSSARRRRSSDAARAS